MVESISNWAQTIITAVIIVTIIEMILPKQSNSKKYMQMIGGLFIIFTIISPIITKFSNVEEFKKNIESYEKYFVIDNSIEVSAQEINTISENQTKSLYISSLKTDIKDRLLEEGYNVISLNIEIEEEDFSKINSISLQIDKNIKENKIEKVNIGEEKEELNDSLTQNEINEIKIYLNLQYSIDKNNIKINM